MYKIYKIIKNDLLVLNRLGLTFISNSIRDFLIKNVKTKVYLDNKLINRVLRILSSKDENILFDSIKNIIINLRNVNDTYSNYMIDILNKLYPDDISLPPEVLPINDTEFGIMCVDNNYLPKNVGTTPVTMLDPNNDFKPIKYNKNYTYIVTYLFNNNTNYLTVVENSDGNVAVKSLYGCINCAIIGVFYCKYIVETEKFYVKDEYNNKIELYTLFKYKDKYRMDTISPWLSLDRLIELGFYKIYNESKPLTIINTSEIQSNITIKLNNDSKGFLNELWYKNNDEQSWEFVSNPDASSISFIIKPKERLSLKTNYDIIQTTNLYRTIIISGGECKIDGNIMSIYSSELYNILYIAPYDCQMFGLFRDNDKLIDVSELKLPCTILTGDNVYRSMFNNCPSIEESPKLPAKKASSNCYRYMFSKCSNLKDLWLGLEEYNETNLPYGNIVEQIETSGTVHIRKDVIIKQTPTSIPTSWNIVEDYID